MRLPFFLLLGVVLSSPAPAAPADPTASEARAEVLVVGVFHMANPGRDVFNAQVDDVLAPKRQAEMVQAIEALKKFRPTKIAVERDPGDSRLTADYADYLVGKHALTRNEIEQLGFRLAKELGHTSVYGVDADGEFPYARLADYAKARDRSAEFEAVAGAWGKMVKAQDAYLASHSILETLRFVNADQRVTQDVQNYHRLVRFGEPWNWAGADLLSDWFRRNMRIYSNVLSLAQGPEDRVLVLFGSGHLGWLRSDFANDPSIRLRKLAEFSK
jgi:hypothetical protein